MCCCSTFIVFIMLRTGAAAEPHSGVCKFLQCLLMFYYFPLCYRILFSNIHEDNPPPPLPQPPPKNTNTHATYTKQLWLLLHLRLCAHYWESGFSLHPRVVFPIDSEKNFNSPFPPWRWVCGWITVAAHVSDGMLIRDTNLQWGIFMRLCKWSEERSRAAVVGTN